MSSHLIGKPLWLVPRYPDTSGPDSIYKLGSILSNPYNPADSLNLNSIPPIPAHLIRDVSSHIRQYVKAELNNTDSLLAKAVLPTIGAVSAKAKVSAEAVTSFDAVDVMAAALKFDADSLVDLKNFIDEAVQSAGVVEYVRGRWFSASLYMIVGVATAKSLSVKETRSGERTVSAGAGTSAGGHVLVPGVKGEVKGEHGRKSKTEGNLDVGSNGECDFAYRVREFVYSEKKGVRRIKEDVSKGAMFGRRGDEEGGNGEVEEEEEDEEKIPEFLEFEEEDVALDDENGGWGDDVMVLQVVIQEE